MSLYWLVITNSKLSLSCSEDKPSNTVHIAMSYLKKVFRGQCRCVTFPT